MATRIALTVVPGARRPGIVGRHGDGWKVRVSASAERGRANEAVLALLAEALALAPSAIRLVGGRTGKRKVVEIAGLTADDVEQRLDAAARRTA
jgi:uncharacterized protein YggU (UPF0235/DUF167 family)